MIQLHHDELKILVTGSSAFDLDEFKSGTDYLNGYSSTHPVIKLFWNIIKNFSEEEMKMLLGKMDTEPKIDY